MKDYSISTPVFKSTLEVFETSDPAHADIVNVPIKQLFHNTLSNRNLLKNLCRYTYDSDRACVVNMLPFDFDGGKLVIPEGMGNFNGDVLVLTGI